MREIILYEDEEVREIVKLDEFSQYAHFHTSSKDGAGSLSLCDSYGLRFADIKRTHEAIEELREKPKHRNHEGRDDAP